MQGLLVSSLTRAKLPASEPNTDLPPTIQYSAELVTHAVDAVRSVFNSWASISQFYLQSDLHPLNYPVSYPDRAFL